ncbi:MAG: hypothetical protein IBJ15_05345 [Alphaproteobacteria bacterium]|nr:hypothetical protein [Alphaproteobacteria bacterium]
MTPEALRARYEARVAALTAATAPAAKGGRVLDPLWRIFGLDSGTLAEIERKREIANSARAYLKAELVAEGMAPDEAAIRVAELRDSPSA